jgi:ATP-dependent DNA helicase RecQ
MTAGPTGRVTGKPSNAGGGGRRRNRRGRGQKRRGRGREESAAESVDEGPLPEPRNDTERAARRIGIRRLHPEQEAGIAAALEGSDVLMVLPTGFGKSAVYQTLSMLLPKPVVLVSPLLALLQDQQDKLIKYDIPCVRLDGTVRGRARKAALERIAEGGSLLVMTTPETLGSDAFAEVIAKSGISLAAIDEAHCISEWGYDFRPAYQRLGERLRAFGAPPLMALTATATEKVREDIVRFLGMRDPKVVSSSPHRSNLAFEVMLCRDTTARLRALARLAQRLRRPGIVYCTTTREVDTVYAMLMKLGIPAHRYHGKMSAGDRNAQQELFMKPGRRTVMVATSAFGLGIDKPDIRYVVHQQSPASLEQYVQEAGRSGRDGAKSNCILLHDPEDRGTHEALLSRSRLRPDQLYRLGNALAAWAGEGRTPDVAALALSAELGDRATTALLVPIEEAGIVEFDDQQVMVTIAPEEVEGRVSSLAGQFENLRTQDSRRLDSIADYANDEGCRASYLREYFGEEGGEPCGLCDVCRGRPERPSTFFHAIAAPQRRGKKKRRGRNRGKAEQRRGKGKPEPLRETAAPEQSAAGPEESAGGSRRSRRNRRRRRRGRRGNSSTPPNQASGAPTTSVEAGTPQLSASSAPAPQAPAAQGSPGFTERAARTVQVSGEVASPITTGRPDRGPAEPVASRPRPAPVASESVTAKAAAKKTTAKAAAKKATAKAATKKTTAKAATKKTTAKAATKKTTAKAATKKTTAKKTTAKAATKKTTAKAATKKTTAKKTTAKAATKKTTARAATKKTTAKAATKKTTAKAATKKTTAKKTTAKAATKKTTAKKAAKKTTAKKAGSSAGKAVDGGS